MNEYYLPKLCLILATVTLVIGETNTTVSTTAAATELVSNATTATTNTTLEKAVEILKDTRRKKHSRSTSSSSGDSESDKSHGKDESLGMSTSASGSHEESNGKGKPFIQGKGWRRWHRQCTQCPDDLRKKWRDPSISWICGGYQRARRSFKSPCMMRYRNCQDGTMFVKIHDHRCKNDTYHGYHFFYDYRVVLSHESSISSDSSSSEYGSDVSDSDSTSESDKSKKKRKLKFID